MDASLEHGHVPVGGRSLEYFAAGTGSPTVVFEAGMGASAAEWLDILPRLASATRAIAFSRAGFGASSPGGPRGADGSVADLAAALEAMGERGPFVLVGHSWGGMLCRLFAASYPERVAALVLVDATHEDFVLPVSRLRTAVGRLGLLLTSVLARTGRNRKALAKGRGFGAQLAKASPELRSAFTDDLCRPSTWRQVRHDSPSIEATKSQLRRTPLPLPTCPVVAIIGGNEDGQEAEARRMVTAAYEPWIPTLPDGRLVVSPPSGHHVPLDDPDLVVKVITDLVRELSQRAR